MPITFNFDIETSSVKDPNDRTRIEVAFLRFGWEHIGGSAWRYPLLDAAAHPSEDWMNHVIPALMYFRSIVEHSGMVVTKFALDAHSEAGYRHAPPIGQPITAANAIHLYPTNLDPKHDEKLSDPRLRKFISDAAQSL